MSLELEYIKAVRRLYEHLAGKHNQKSHGNKYGSTDVIKANVKRLGKDKTALKRMAAKARGDKDFQAGVKAGADEKRNARKPKTRTIAYNGKIFDAQVGAQYDVDYADKQKKTDIIKAAVKPGDTIVAKQYYNKVETGRKNKYEVVKVNRTTVTVLDKELEKIAGRPIQANVKIDTITGIILQ
jgi:hypothetical protein